MFHATRISNSLLFSRAQLRVACLNLYPTFHLNSETLPTFFLITRFFQNTTSTLIGKYFENHTPWIPPPPIIIFS
jgi:hypothetical protein